MLNIEHFFDVEKRLTLISSLEILINYAFEHKFFPENVS